LGSGTGSGAVDSVVEGVVVVAAAGSVDSDFGILTVIAAWAGLSSVCVSMVGSTGGSG
jgi:hypothetical protein